MYFLQKLYKYYYVRYTSKYLINQSILMQLIDDCEIKDNI